jgi:lipid A ethanolaminephosphotransferase
MSLSFYKLKMNSVTLTLLLSVYFTSILNFSLFKNLHSILSASSGVDFLFVVSIPVFFVCAFAILFTPFVCKYITKIFFSLLILVSAAVNYTSFHFGLVFNKEMIVNFLETTPAEATSYLNANLILWYSLTGLIPVLFLNLTHIQYRNLSREIIVKFIFVTCAIAVIAIIGAFYYKDYASLTRNHPKIVKDIVPTYFTGSASKYIRDKHFQETMKYTKIGSDAIQQKEKERYLIFFMVGETARATNYQWHGYNRATNAYSQNLENIFFYKNATSCGTSTAVSLPCMFSFLSRENFSEEKFESQDNVVDVFKRAGVPMIWLDNNTGCKGVCKSIPNFSISNIPSLQCKEEECDDGIFLKLIDEKVKTLGDKGGIVFLHLIGSNGPTYFKRYPRTHAQFLPDCQTSDLQKCSQQEIINSYDNTILYTDYIFSELVKKLKTYDKNYHTALFYVSDHGESLGEKGLYLHGMPYAIAPEEQTHIPFMLWLSDKMIAHKNLDKDCLKSNSRTEHVSHENVPHLLLGLMNVKTKDSNPNLDPLHNCKTR